MSVTKRNDQDKNYQEQEIFGLDAPSAEQHTFDPARHIVRLRGGDYLEVKWRLLWLRNEHPDAQIETEMVHFDPQQKIAVFKARISIPQGGSSTGWGSETSDDFKDFIEKAETKAIGRACAALGFGTQHCLDFDYDSNSVGKVVDAPVNYPAAKSFSRAGAPSQNLSNSSNNSGSFGSGAGGFSPNTSASVAATSLATEKQVKFIYSTGRDQGLSDEQIISRCKEKFGVEPDQLSKNGASRFIDMLKQPA